MKKLVSILLALLMLLSCALVSAEGDLDKDAHILVWVPDNAASAVWPEGATENDNPFINAIKEKLEDEEEGRLDASLVTEDAEDVFSSLEDTFSSLEEVWLVEEDSLGVLEGAEEEEGAPQETKAKAAR